MASEPANAPTSTTVDLAGLPVAVVNSIRQLVESLREGMASEHAPTATTQRPPLRGRFAELKLSIPKEDIDEAQREAWEHFPREFPKPGNS